MAIADHGILSACNPATGEPIGRVPVTPSEEVAGIVARAREAQRAWEARPWRERRAALARWRGVLARDADEWAEALRAEVGKPRGEALAEVIATLDQLRWTIRHAGRVLADERLPRGWQRWMLIPPARLRWRPVGVVGVLGTWNYPLFLTAPVIAQALAAGNAVVWKPSELAPLIGERLRRSLDAAGLPGGLVGTASGGPDVGRALVASEIDLAQFTGGIDAGRSVLAALGARGVPAVAELSGFDPAIVLPDAPLGSTARALAWAAFSNAGQTCVAVKRVYVVGESGTWAGSLAAEARALRVGDPSGAVDVGPMISAAARARFDDFVRAAVAAGARVRAGGAALPGPGWFYAPTVLEADADDPAPEAALAGCFGPVALVRGVPDVDAAVAAANAGPFGLAASVWGRDRAAARAAAGRIAAGMVAINDAVAPLAHAAAPFGGVKASGYGRVHGAPGLRALAQPQVVHARRPGGLRPHLFPYSGRTLRVLGLYRRWFHPGGR